MEFESFKTAWQNQPEGSSLSSPADLSRSLRFLRTSAIRDLQKSDELSRLVFCILFALVAAGFSFVIMSPGAGRVACWLFAAALIFDGIAGVALLARRLHEPATATVVDFIRREQRQMETRVRFERWSQRLMVVLAGIALILVILGPSPAGTRERAFDALGKSAVVTAFLAVAWRRAKSRSKEVGRELERYLKDLSE